MIDLLEIERACVETNADQRCDRDCANCNLVQDDKELIEMYTKVANMLGLLQDFIKDYKES